MEKCRMGMFVKFLLLELYLERGRWSTRFALPSNLLEPFLDHHFRDDVRADAVQFLDDVRIGNVDVDGTELQAMVAKENDKMARLA